MKLFQIKFLLEVYQKIVIIFIRNIRIYLNNNLKIGIKSPKRHFHKYYSERVEYYTLLNKKNNFYHN